MKYKQTLGNNRLTDYKETRQQVIDAQVHTLELRRKPADDQAQTHLYDH